MVQSISQQHFPASADVDDSVFLIGAHQDGQVLRIASRFEEDALQIVGSSPCDPTWTAERTIYTPHHFDPIKSVHQPGPWRRKFALAERGQFAG